MGLLWDDLDKPMREVDNRVEKIENQIDFVQQRYNPEHDIDNGPALRYTENQLLDICRKQQELINFLLLKVYKFDNEIWELKHPDS